MGKGLNYARRDPALRVVSYAARGLFGDILCIMEDNDRKGYLQHAAGEPITTEQLARMTGGSVDEVFRLLQELTGFGVLTVTEDGSYRSPRIIREETRRQKCAQAGKKGGGNPAFGTPLDRPLKVTYKGHPKGLGSDPPENEDVDLQQEIGTPLKVSPKVSFKGEPKGQPEKILASPPHTPPLSLESNTNNINISREGEKGDARGKRTKTPKTPPPENFEINAKILEAAKDGGIENKNIKFQIEMCLDHFRATGEWKANWQSTICNWLRRAKEFERKYGAPKQPYPTKPTQAQLNAEALAKFSRRHGIDEA